MGITLNRPPRGTADSPAARATGSTAAIGMHDVRVRRGGREVLHVEDLDIPYGVTALVGPNGSGKSTLLHAIAGVLPAASGSIDIGGRVAYVLQSQHAQYIGYRLI